MHHDVGPLQRPPAGRRSAARDRPGPAPTRCTKPLTGASPRARPRRRRPSPSGSLARALLDRPGPPGAVVRPRRRPSGAGPPRGLAAARRPAARHPPPSADEQRRARRRRHACATGSSSAATAGGELRRRRRAPPRPAAPWPGAGVQTSTASGVAPPGRQPQPAPGRRRPGSARRRRRAASFSSRVPTLPRIGDDARGRAGRARIWAARRGLPVATAAPAGSPSRPAGGAHHHVARVLARRHRQHGQAGGQLARGGPWPSARRGGRARRAAPPPAP